jgi:hypothetical protein
VSEELATRDESSLRQGLASVWGRIAPLSVGAVVSSAAIIATSTVLRRVLGPRARVLGWVGTIVVVPLGAWLLTRRDERTETDPGAVAAELTNHTEKRELENPEN